MTKRLDLIIWGATGFTGRLCAEYMAAKYGVGRQVAWAIAGRNLEKLEEIKQSLVHIDESLQNLKIIVANSDDKLSLRDMCEQTKVVVTTVGPYLRVGYNLVEAAIEAGTHYCDLTGEGPFLKRIIERNNEAAIRNVVKIVNCCGFDCIPVDLGTLMVCEYMKSQEVEIMQVHTVAGKIKGGISGGTVASGMEIIDRSTWRELKQLRDPYLLLGEIPRPTSYDSSVGISYSKRLQSWTIPYIMAAIDIPVVQRSNALQNFAYGHKFRYYESMAVPNFAVAVLGYLAVNFFGVLSLFRPFRWLIRKLMPQGSGPSEHVQNTGCMNMHILGDGVANGTRVAVKGLVSAHGVDPGYKLTAQMLCESALCLVFDASKLPARYGILTPASAMGNVLIERLKQTTVMKFEVTEV